MKTILKAIVLISVFLYSCKKEVEINSKLIILDDKPYRDNVPYSESVVMLTV